MRKSLSLLLVLMTALFLIPTGAYAQSAQEKANQAFENIQKQSDKELEEVLAHEEPKASSEDPEATVDNLSIKMLVWWYALRKGFIRVSIPFTIVSVIFGYLIAVIFRKDKFRQKFGYGIMISVPICVGLVIYGPAILAVFQQ